MTDAGLRRAAAGAAAVATAVSGVAIFWLALRLPSLHADPAASAATVPFVVGMLVLSATGALATRTRPGAVIGWLLIGTGLLGVLGGLSFSLAVLAHSEGFRVATGLGWVTNWAWVPGQVAALLLVLRFPDGRLPSPRWRWLQSAILGWGLVALVVTATVPGELAAEQLAPMTNPLGLAAAAGVLDAALSTLFVLQPVLLLLAVVAAVLRWRSGDPVERRQLTLVAAALVLLAVATPLALVVDAGQVVAGVAWLLVPATIAYAVTRYGLWDVDVNGRLDRLQRARAAERARLQRDLHDSVGPVLGSIALRLEAARNIAAAHGAATELDGVLASIGADVEGAVVEVRRLIDELGPSALDDADLLTALEELVDRHREAGLSVSLLRPGELPPLEPAVEVAAYRVAGEALRNALRHADARHCEVSLRVEGADLVLDVVDDGVGLRGQPAGVGRRAMAQRVADLGGELVVAEPESGGVHVRARLVEVVR